MEEDEALTNSPTLQNIKRNREVASSDSEEIKRLEERFSGREEDLPEEPSLQEKGNLFTESLKDIPGSVASGVARTVQETGNFVIDAADMVENFMAEQGIGGGDFINEGSRITALTNPENVYQPRTTVGHLVSGITQFMVPFALLGEVTKGVKVVSTLGKFAKASALGAAVDFTAFDPKEERLSNLIQRHTPLRDPVTTYLAANPSDTRAEGRFKNALEGLGLGAVVEMFTMGLKAYRGNRVAQSVKKDADEVLRIANERDIVLPDETVAPKPVEGVKAEDTFGELDGIKKEVKEARKTPRMESSLPDTPIDVEDQILSALERGDIDAALTAKRGAGTTPEFKRGEISIEESTKAAEKLGLNAADFMKRKEGGLLTDAETVKIAQVMESTTERLNQLTKNMDPNNPADLELLLDEMDNVDLLIARSEGFGAEVARTLNLNKLVKKARGQMVDAARNRQLQDKYDLFGGSETATKLKERLKNMKAADLADVSKRSFGRKLTEAAYETWINGLLSRPMTQIRNIGSNASVVAMDVVESKVAVGKAEGRIAEAITKNKAKLAGAIKNGESSQIIEGIENTIEMLPTSERVFKGEAEIQIESIIGGFKDALEMGRQAFKSGKVSAKSGKISPVKMSSEFFKQEIDKIPGAVPKAVVSKSIDMLGKMTTLPGRTLYTADEFFKAVNMRKEVHRLAHREASLEGLQKGWSTDEVISRTESLIQKPSPTIISGAEKAKLVNTFQTPAEELELFFDAAAVKGALNNPIGKVITPFINTNLNLLDFSMRRLPVELGPGLRADLLEGGVRADLAKARISLSRSTLAVGASLTLAGTITGGGPSDFKSKKLWLEAGNVPYSFKIPGTDTRIAFDRFDPLGQLLGASADVSDLLGQMVDDGVSKLDLVGGAALTVGRFMTPEFATESLAPFLEMLRPGSDSGREMEKFITSFGSSAIPLSGAMSTIRKGIPIPFTNGFSTGDPIKRDLSVAKDSESPIWDGFLNQFKNTIPGWSSSLPAATNVFGEEKVYYTGFGDSNTSPLLANKPDEMSKFVSGELLKLGMDNPLVNADPKKGETFLTVDNPSRIIRKGGVSTPLNPAQYEKYKRLAGGLGLKESPFGGMNLKEALNEQFKNDFPLIEGSKSDEMKRIVVKKIFSAFRKAAAAQFFEEDDNIYEKVQQNAENRSNAILGLE